MRDKNFSNSLIIHTISNQSARRISVTCMPLDTPVKNWSKHTYLDILTHGFGYPNTCVWKSLRFQIKHRWSNVAFILLRRLSTTEASLTVFFRALPTYKLLSCAQLKLRLELVYEKISNFFYYSNIFMCAPRTRTAAFLLLHLSALLSYNLTTKLDEHKWRLMALIVDIICTISFGQNLCSCYIFSCGIRNN